jgi:hypothetical protein
MMLMMVPAVPENLGATERSDRKVRSSVKKLLSRPDESCDQGCTTLVRNRGVPCLRLTLMLNAAPSHFTSYDATERMDKKGRSRVKKLLSRPDAS